MSDETRDWLKKMAEKEDGQIVSVGGLAADLERLEKQSDLHLKISKENSERAGEGPRDECGPCCAHLHIEYKRSGPNDYTVTAEWWECRDCKTRFIPEGKYPALLAERDGLKRHLDLLEGTLKNTSIGELIAERDGLRERVKKLEEYKNDNEKRWLAIAGGYTKRLQEQAAEIERLSSRTAPSSAAGRPEDADGRR